MAMKSRDVVKAELLEKLGAAVDKETPEGIAEVLTGFALGVQEDVMKDFQQYQQTQDEAILAKRGVHTLTGKEKRFYEAVIQAGKTGDIKAAFTGLDSAFPETVIDAALEDIKTNHPLLSKINFRNTATLTKIIVNATGAQLATWGPLTDAFKKELTGAIKVINLTKSKLSAFFPISKDMLDAGPQWVDAFVREVLAEAIAAALEKSIITGTGKDEPIGMDRDVSDNVSTTGGVYPKKTAVVITELSVAQFGAIAAKLAKSPTGKYRAVPEILLVVNPVDYFTKVMPATTVRAADGSYASNIFPYPTDVVQSAEIEEGEALFGLSGRYFMGVGTGGMGGKIDFSDEVRFLEDERVYASKLYGDGRALDDNAFVLADISGLQPYTAKVTVKEVQGTVKTKAEA